MGLLKQGWDKLKEEAKERKIKYDEEKAAYKRNYEAGKAAGRAARATKQGFREGYNSSPGLLGTVDRILGPAPRPYREPRSSYKKHERRESRSHERAERKPASSIFDMNNHDYDLFGISGKKKRSK